MIGCNCDNEDDNNDDDDDDDDDADDEDKKEDADHYHHHHHHHHHRHHPIIITIILSFTAVRETHLLLVDTVTGSIRRALHGLPHHTCSFGKPRSSDRVRFTCLFGCVFGLLRGTKRKLARFGISPYLATQLLGGASAQKTRKLNLPVQNNYE